jgi:hypothetical protein
VRFSDLAKRWAVDPKYGNSIEWVAQKFRSEFCAAGGGGKRQEVEVLPWQRTSDAQPVAPKEAGSAVRTVWRQDQSKASVAEITAPKRKAVADAVPAKAGAVSAKTQAAAAAESAVAPAGMPDPVAPAIVAEAVFAAEEPHFALFTPPAALADASAPEAGSTGATVALVAPVQVVNAPERAVSPQQDVGSEQSPAIAARGTSEDRTRTASAAADSVMGPPPPSDAGTVEVATDVATLAPPEEEPPTATVQAAKSTFLPPSGLGVKPGRCVVETATFAGDTTVLVKSPVGADMHYIALSVLEGFEDSMARSFIEARPQGGEALGTYRSKDAAITYAKSLCPD